jgi:hypothetical protein
LWARICISTSHNLPSGKTDLQKKIIKYIYIYIYIYITLKIHLNLIPPINISKSWQKWDLSCLNMIILVGRYSLDLLVAGQYRRKYMKFFHRKQRAISFLLRTQCCTNHENKRRLYSITHAFYCAFDVLLSNFLNDVTFY